MEDHSLSSPELAVFDFDGTLTRRDSLPGFLLSACGLRAFVLRLPLIVVLKLAVLLRLLPAGRAKERVFASFFRGMEEADFLRRCRRYAGGIPRLLRPGAEEEIRTHLRAGHGVLIVTASMPQWIAPWAGTAGVRHVIGTEPEVRGGRLTGHFATPNCKGEEKVRRFSEKVPALSEKVLHVYGDSRSDFPMLALARFPHYKPFRENTRPGPKQYAARALRNLRLTLREARHLLFPPGRAEMVLLLVLFLLYAWLGAHVLLHTRLLDATSPAIGTYLGYDNLAHLRMQGGTFDISHPFFPLAHLLKTLFLLPFSALGHGQAGLFGLLLGTSLLTAGSVTLVFRYLRRIAGLPTGRALLPALCCAAFFTTAVLSFTPETYPFSLAALTFALLFLSEEWKKLGHVRGRSVFLLTFLCGGITLTNAAKPLLALLLNRMPDRRAALRSLLKTALPFAACVVLLFAAYTAKIKLLAPEEPSPVENTLGLKAYFDFDNARFPKLVGTDFWGNTLLATPLEPQTVGRETVLRPTSYESPWQTALVGLIFALCAASAWQNRRNKYVQMLLLFLSVDFFAHIVLRYGIEEAVIFGGHWLFAVPVLLGWAYRGLPRRLRSVLDGFLLLALAALLLHNGAEFWRVFRLFRC